MQAQIRIALAGGGGASDSLPLDQVFARWVGTQGRLLYWPVALRGTRPFQSCLDWIRATFEPLGITNITMWTELSEHQARELNEFDAVYIGGGNTYALLAQLLQNDFDRHLMEYIQRGRAIYGGSAGAVVLGRDIRSVKHLDRNEVGLKETSGLDVAEGHVIWVHYRPEDDDLIDAYAERYAQPVLAMSERSGIVIDEAGIRSVGFEGAYRFDEQGKHLV
ncbi:MAG: Type 1 glutamine amidotransferase-like domain-containing protein [Anaerolineae bacterium]|nr:Type 1 glutamine amidotransferase-like domain-containing protein [Anaerolineae bacterium]